MRMGMSDQLELFGAGCRPASPLAHWSPPTPAQALRDHVAARLDQPIRRSVPAPWDPSIHEDPERWDGLG